MFKLGDIIELDDFNSESELDDFNCFWRYGDISMLTNDLLIKDSIGGGSMGDVYELEDKNLVIKIIEDPGYSDNLDALISYNKENNLGEVSAKQVRDYFIYDIAKEVKYQHLVYNRIKGIDGKPVTPKVIAACVCKSKNDLIKGSTKIGIIIMEKIKGISMYKLLHKKENNIPLDNLISIREQLINIIRQLKKNNIVHSDMSKSNIIIRTINTRPVVKIIDWGFATTIEMYPYIYSKDDRENLRLENSTWEDIKLLDKIIEKKSILLEMKNNAIEKLNKILAKQKSPLDSGGYKKRKYSHKKCPRGSISRRGYIYLKKSTGKRIRVKSGCIKSKGLRSRGKKSNRVLPKLKKGSLTKYGYSTSVSESKRHIALKKALKAYGYSTLVKKLNAVKLLTKNTNPKNSRIYGRDLKWIQRST